MKAPAFKRVLRRGVKGHDVTALQRALIAAGVRNLHPTGEFRRATEDEVKRYKRLHHLSPLDGVVREAMWHDLAHRGYFDPYDAWLVDHVIITPPPSDKRLAARHAAALSYALRWQIGYIQERPMRDMAILPGNLNTEMDCSEAWKWWRRCGGMSPGDNLGWSYGNTESLKQFGTTVTTAKLRIADAVFYGTGTPSDPYHMAFYAGAGMVYSHGSQAAPYYLPLAYRTVRQLRTYEPL